jgi:hypothetical protein
MNKDEMPYYNIHNKEITTISNIEFNKDKWKKYLNDHTSTNLINRICNNPLFTHYTSTYPAEASLEKIKDKLESFWFNPLLNKIDANLFLLSALCIKAFTVPIKPRKTVVGLQALEALFKGKTLIDTFNIKYKAINTFIFSTDNTGETKVFNNTYFLLTHTFEIIEND